MYARNCQANPSSAMDTVNTCATSCFTLKIRPLVSERNPSKRWCQQMPCAFSGSQRLTVDIKIVLFAQFVLVHLSQISRETWDDPDCDLAWLWAIFLKRIASLDVYVRVYVCVSSGQAPLLMVLTSRGQRSDSDVWKRVQQQDCQRFLLNITYLLMHTRAVSADYYHV